MNQKSLNWGVGITVIWLAVIFFLWFFGGLKSPESLNELGDALAGIVAPIAFLWLILGYIQQGKQLDQNTKALEQQERALQLQIEEMKESVNQQKNLTFLQKEQLEALYISVKPDLYVDKGTWEYLQLTDIKTKEKTDSYKVNLTIKNVGIGQARYIELWHSNGCQIDFSLDEVENSFSKVNKLDKDNAIEINILLFDYELNFNNKDNLFTLKIKYQDIYNQTYEGDFDIDFYYENDESKSGEILAYLN